MEKELLLTNVKEKFKQARTLCPGMSDEIYMITDHLSNIANNELVPTGLALCIALLMSDITNEKSSFSTKLPEEFLAKKNILLREMVYIPQIIDVIASEDFAIEFRNICKNIFGFNPPKRANAEPNEEYPGYIKAAIDWWADAIQSPKFDNGVDINPALMLFAQITENFTEDQIILFKETLAKGIKEEIKKYGNCTIDVDYHPCEILAIAGQKIGVRPMGYPFKTHMYITQEKVEVSAGYRADYKTIWSKEPKKDPEGTPSIPFIL